MVASEIAAVVAGIDGRMVRTSTESQQQNAPEDQLTARIASLIISGKKNQQTLATNMHRSATRCDNVAMDEAAVNRPLYDG